MTQPSTQQQSAIRILLLPALVVLLLCLIAGALALHYETNARADKQGQTLARQLGHSTAVLVQPLVLSDDRISLNYIFSQLATESVINGLRLTSNDNSVIARAGQESGIHHLLDLKRRDQDLGQLEIWISGSALAIGGNNELILSGLWAAATLILVALTFMLSLRRFKPAPSKTNAHAFNAHTSHHNGEPDFGTYLQQQTGAAAYAAQAEDEQETDISIADGDTVDWINEALAEDEAELKAKQAQDAHEEDDDQLPLPDDQPDDAPAQTATSDSETVTAETPHSEPEDDIRVVEEEYELPVEEDELPAQETSAPGPLRASRDDALETDHSPLNSQVAEQSKPANSSEERDSLIDLLKPERNQPRMPHFTPSEPQQDPLQIIEFESDDQPAPAVEKSTSRVELPPFNQEEQLGLISLDQELELMLSADEAGYLLLIDSTSAHSDNLEEAERKALLRNYRTLANSVARIYNAQVEASAAGDLQLIFDQPNSDDTHGANAICASLLFTALYKQYNQLRIRQFKPVMNLHMALVRGHYQKLNRLHEEARFLTRTTQTNELISHTTLTEAPKLKETLLKSADMRREDEDKVLILKVAGNYQSLLEKQARHLLSKLQAREEQSS